MTIIITRYIRMALVLFAGVLTWASGMQVLAQAPGTRHALIISGLGGTPDYTAQFDSYVSDMQSLLVDRHGFSPDRVYVLAELAEKPYVNDVSTAENIQTHFNRLVESVETDDYVFIFLFGHGSYDGTTSRLNIPRRDLDDVDYADLVDGLAAGRVIFINTASASGPFAETLSRRDRIVITATASGNERDETNFPRHFIDALRSPDGDLDKNGAVSISEAFRYAARETRGMFENAGQIATEHPLLDDDGDGSPSRLDAVENGVEGNLAALTYFSPPTAQASVPAAARPLLREKGELEQSIAELKGRKTDIAEDEYYSELETLFVRLARLNDRIEAAD